MGWRQVAKALKEQEGGGDDRDVRDDSPVYPPNVPIVSNVPRGISLNCPSHWRAKLAALDPDNPPQSMAPNRWRTLLADALWLAEAHGPAAAALGWTEAQLFAVNGQAGWGGLADRLEGARHLSIDHRKAVWRWEASATDEWSMLIRQGRTGRLALGPNGVLIWE